MARALPNTTRTPPLTIRAVRIGIKLRILKQLEVRHLVYLACAVLAEPVDGLARSAREGHLYADAPRARARRRGAKGYNRLAEEHGAVADPRCSDETGRRVSFDVEVTVRQLDPGRTAAGDGGGVVLPSAISGGSTIAVPASAIRIRTESSPHGSSWTTGAARPVEATATTANARSASGILLNAREKAQAVANSQWPSRKIGRE